MVHLPLLSNYPAVGLVLSYVPFLSPLNRIAMRPFPFALCLYGWLLLLGSGPAWTQGLPDVFGYQTPETHLVKLDLVGLAQGSVQGVVYGEVRMGYEQKLHPGWSVLVELMRDVFWQWPNRRLAGRPDPIYTLIVEPRHYLMQNQDVQAGARASNFSGNYVTLSTSLQVRDPQVPWDPSLSTAYLYADHVGLAPLFGMQRRILRYGFVDFRMGMEWQYRRPSGPPRGMGPDPRQGWQVGPAAHLRIGLGL